MTGRVHVCYCSSEGVDRKPELLRRYGREISIFVRRVARKELATAGVHDGRGLSL